MNHPSHVEPEPYEWVDEPTPGQARAIDGAQQDLAAGRSVICTSTAGFDALLDELGTAREPASS